MKDKRLQNFEMLTLALGIALLPSLWAVLSSYGGMRVGAIALVCAGLFVASGNKIAYSMRISAGYLIGLAWGVIALKLMEIVPLNRELTQFLVLFFLGGLAVILANKILARKVYLPAWLCGWAITLGLLGNLPKDQWGPMIAQIAIAMIVGILYVGVGVIKFQRLLLRSFAKQRKA